MATIEGYSEEAVDVLEAEFAKVIQSSIVNVLARTANALQPAIIASSSAGVNPSDIDIITQLWQEEVDGVLTTYIGEVYTGSATAIAIGVGNAFPDPNMPGVPLVADSYAVTYLQSITNQLTGVSDELWEDVRAELLDGLQKGQSIEQIQARIVALGNFTEKDAATIARTQIHSAVEAGNIAQMRFMGYEDNEVKKKWVATLGDGRTRPTHIAAHDQEVLLNEKFVVGGSHLDVPGDFSGPADETQNCRCTVIYDIQDPPPFRCNGDLTAAVTHAQDASQCVVPITKPPVNWDYTPPGEHLSLSAIIHNYFMNHGISPAYGGAKIYKTLQLVKKELADAGYPLSGLTDYDLLAAVDKYYVAKKDTFFDKFVTWVKSPAGTKALGAQKPLPITAVKAPIAPQTTTAFDVAKAKEYLPAAVEKRARIVTKPDGVTTTITPEWGGEQSFVGSYVEVLGDDDKVRYGSALKEWLDMHEEVPGKKDTWVKTASVKAYQWDGPDTQFTTTLADGTVETSKTAKKGSWVVKQKNGEVQILDDSEMKKLYQMGTAKKASPLPPIPGAPNPADLTFTGQTMGGVTGSTVWVDKTGQKWLFKAPKSGSNAYSSKFLLDLESAIARIQSLGKVTRPAIYQIELGGKKGIIQHMFDSKSAWPSGKGFDPLTLSADDLLVLQQTQIFDWMVSNFDTHTGQFLRLSDGTLLGIDKGQAFKFFGKDKLDWDYVPVTPIAPDKLTYQPLWKAYVQGKKVDLQDPTTGPLGEYMEKLMAIPDDQYRELLRPYAEGRVSLFEGGTAAEQAVKVEKFLDRAVKRKNNLKQDFADFWARAQAERAKHITPPPVPKPPAPSVTPTPTVSTVTPGSVMSDTDISGVTAGQKKLITDHWLDIGGGKKVTPGWGGAKVFKMLDELQKAEAVANEQLGLEPLTHLQLLRILDEQGGFKGKPKTYESVVMDWLQSPQSTNTLLKMGYTSPPKSLKLVASVPKAQAVTPITPSGVVKIATKKEGDVVFTDEIFGFADEYPIGAVIAEADGPGFKIRLIGTGNVNEVRIENFDIANPSTGWVYGGTVKVTDHQMVGVLDKLSWKIPTTAAKPAVNPIAGKTIIPGKVPGDVVSPAEIEASKYLWNQGDIIATITHYAHDYRLVSDGSGGVIVELKNSLGEWIDFGKKYEATKKLPATIYGMKKWQLTQDVLAKTKPSPIPGYMAGQTVPKSEVMAVPTMSSKPGDVYVYAMSEDTGDLYRLVYSATGGKKIEWQSPSGNWTWAGTVYNETDFANFGMSTFKWYAANADGTIPDVLKALVPGKTTPGFGKTSHIKYKSEGDIVSHTEIWDAQYGNPVPGSVIAKAKTKSGAEYRVIYDTDDQLHIQVKSSTSPGGWFDANIASTADDIDLGSDVTWIASSDVVSASKPVSVPIKKAAKAAKAAPPPKPKYLTGNDTALGVPVGTTGIDQQAIFAAYNSGSVVEGQIIATLKKTGWDAGEWRVFVADGKLVQQKKTKAGAWGGTKIINQYYQLEYGSYAGKWTAANDIVTDTHLKAAKKIVAKKTAPPPSGPMKKVSSPGTSKASTSTVVKPFKMRAVDLSHWDQDERKEIYDWVRGQHNVYVSSSPEQIWGAIQSAKYHFQTTKGGKYVGLNEIEILRIVDEQGALKHGVTDTHPLESKIVHWLKSAQGKAYVNKKIDAPVAALDVPVPMSDFAAGGDMSTQIYADFTRAESLQQRIDSHAKYGGWKTGQKAALKKYTGGSYTSWNDAIRKGDLGSYKDDIIKAQLGMRPSVRPMLLHRKASFAEFNDPSIVSYDTLLPYVGRTYVNRGFNSTSYTSGAWSGTVHFEIEAPIGTPMSHAQDYSNYGHEEEVTLAAHLIYQIMSVKKKGSQTVVRVRVIGAAGQP